MALVVDKESDELFVGTGERGERTFAKVSDVTSNAVMAEYIPVRERERWGKESERVRYGPD